MITQSVPMTFAELWEYDAYPSPSPEGLRFLCPSAGCADKPRDTAHRSLAVNMSTGLYQCFRCEIAGRLPDMQPKPNATAVRGSARTKRHNLRLREQFGINAIPNPKANPSGQRPIGEVPSWLSAYHQLGTIEGTAGEVYLTSRGIDSDVAQSIGMRFGSWGREGDLALVTPFRGATGQIVAVEARYIVPRDIRYRAHGEKHTGVVPILDVAGSSVVAVTEGVITGLTLAQLGLPVLALGGKDIPQCLPSMVVGKTVILAFDADEAGQRGLSVAMSRLSLARKRIPVHVQDIDQRSTVSDWNDVLQDRGIDRLRSLLFALATGDDQRQTYADIIRWTGEAYDPHPALVQALMTCDLEAYFTERERWVGGVFA